MKTLNKLTAKERLELYKKARVDWTERPNDEDACTDWGLCGYFEDAHGIDALACRKKEWEVHVLQQIGKNGRYIFLGETGDPEPRIAALNAMIKELEAQL